MYKFNLDDDSLQAQLQGKLAGMLSPEMQERYKQKRQEAIDSQKANYQGPEAIEALKDGQNMRALQAGFQRAANKFGSVGGDGGPQSDFGETAKAFDASAKQNFALKQDAYNSAVKAENDAVDGEYTNTVARPMAVGEGIGTLNNQQREADLNAKLDPLKVDSAITANKSAALDFKNQSNLSDPNSAESMALKNFAKSKYPSLKVDGNTTGAMLYKLIPFVERSEEAKSRADAMRESREARAEAAREAQENRDFIRQQNAESKAASEAAKKAEKDEQLKIEGFGFAKTAEDAKNLKAGVESKAAFDSKLDELISLRQKHNGGALLNRDDVGRAQQLSKDLLLAYKDMAKLGVLSASDEKILNAIIPSDPLEYNSPLAAVQGQDPVLHKMQKFKLDSQKDFDTKLNQRLRGGYQASAGMTENTSADKKPNISHGNDLP